MTGGQSGSAPIGARLGAGVPARGAASAETTVAAVLRALVASGVLLSAAVHFDLYSFGGGKHLPGSTGTLFLLNFVAGMVLGFAVQVWRHWVVVFLAAGFALVTVLFFYAAVIWGLWGFKETLGGPSQIFAQIVEWVAFLAGGVLLLLQWSGRSLRR